MPQDISGGEYELAGPELLEEVDGLQGQDREMLRDLARTDLYFLCVGVLGYRHVNLRVHGGFCRHIQNCPTLRRGLLMPRGHLKSSVGTVAHNIQLGIADPDDYRGLIIGETATLAEGFLGSIKNHFLQNKILRGLFPELIPERTSGPGVTWRNDAASLNRSTSWPEPTWTALGVGGASVGKHFRRIKCDDLIGFDAMRSAAVLAYAKAYVDNIEPLLIDPASDIIDFIGTRWSRNDIFAHLMAGYGEDLAMFTRQAVEDGEIIFPQKYSWKIYERIQRINPAQWAAQYLNNPLTSLTTDFAIQALRTFRFTHDEQRVVLGPHKTWNVAELDRVLTADPNSGSGLAPDAAAVSVQGYSPDEEVCVLDSVSDRFNPSDFVDKIYQLARKWKVRVVGIEKAGQQNTAFYFKQKAEQEGYHVQIEELSPQSHAASWEQDEGKKGAKKARIRAALQPIIKSGLLYILPSQTTLRQQLSDFPDCILWDEADALAYGPALWRKPEKQEVVRRREGVMQRILAMRNRVTGY